MSEPAKQTTQQDPAEPSAPDLVARLVQQNVAELIGYCRHEILARPRLQAAVEQFHIDDSDDWLRQAVLSFRLSLKSGLSPAVEWHDEVGELNFAVGLTVADASDFLSILRDGVLRLAWRAVSEGDLAGERMHDIETAVLGAFDRALDAQASAYVRESQRHLSEVNRNLAFRQTVFERDLLLARRVQQQFIPKNLESENFRAEVRYSPTESIGGDHAGLFAVTPDRLYVTICDVTGHGIASALVAEMVNSQLRLLLRRPADPAFEYAIEPVDIVRELNGLFFTEFQELGMLLSFFIAQIDLEEGTLTYSGAGHPPPIFQCCSAHNFIELRSQNIILGAAEDCVLGRGQDTVPVHRGDRILFYTDGIIEAADDDGRMLGLAGLRSIVSGHFGSPQTRLADEILLAARTMYGENQTDDMSLIVVDVLAGSGDRRP